MTEPIRDSESNGSDAIDEWHRSLLLQFVSTRDINCPACGYNLRGLSTPVCPECRESLRLTIGMIKPRMGWFLLTIIPGVFSAGCAVLLTATVVTATILSPGPAGIPFGAILLDSFGWLSGMVAWGLYLKRYWFLRLPRRVQILWAGVAWLLHVVAFAITLTTILF